MSVELSEKELSPVSEDLEYLQDQLEKIHKDLYRNVDKEAFTQSLQKSLDVEQRFLPIAIQESLALLGDAHTMIPDVRYNFPYRIYLKYFNSDLYVIGADEKSILGLKIERINSYDIGVVEEAVEQLSSKETEEVRKRDVAAYTCNSMALDFFGYGNSESFTVGSGSKDIQITKSDEERRLRNLLNPYDWWGKKYVGNDIYRYRYIGNTLLFQYNVYDNIGHTQEELDNFKTNLRKEIDNSQKIVVDLRHNQGGDSTIMDDYIDNFPTDKEFYVAIGPRTYSTAMHHTMWLKQDKSAKLIGERAGQKLNRFGAPKKIVLPNSGVKVNCATKYFELDPDIPLPLTIDHYMNHEDPLDKWIEENL